MPEEPVVVVDDPFAVDETKFASLAPEQRAALDPVLEEWKTKARGEVDRTTKTWEEKYKPVEEKAQALEKLVQDPRFQSWWSNVQNATDPNNQTGAKPQDFATPEEYQQAISDAYAGNGNKLKEIQARMFSAMATPVVLELKKSQQELRDSQDEFRLTQEMKDLFERHPEASELDKIGRNLADPKDESESLLESCLEWAKQNKRPMEEGYQRAQKWATALKVGAEQKALGIVQGKKESVTSGPSTAKVGQVVVEVADADELMQRNMDDIASGRTPSRYVIRKQEVVNSGNRWGQRN